MIKLHLEAGRGKVLARLIAKSGQINAHHWAHQARVDCDACSELIGSWHLGWQGLVRPEFVEIVKGPQRADIFNGRTVVERLIERRQGSSQHLTSVPTENAIMAVATSIWSKK